MHAGLHVGDARLRSWWPTSTSLSAVLHLQRTKMTFKQATGQHTTRLICLPDSPATLASHVNTIFHLSQLGGAAVPRHILPGSEQVHRIFDSPDTAYQAYAHAACNMPLPHNFSSPELGHNSKCNCNCNTLCSYQSLGCVTAAAYT